LRRGELLLAKQGCDCYVKRLLVELEAWRVRYEPPDSDIWHTGGFFEEWAGRDTLMELPDAFGAYESSDVSSVLLLTVELFGDHGGEVAGRGALVRTVPHEEIRFRTVAHSAEGLRQVGYRAIRSGSTRQGTSWSAS
jgi:aminoglycoside 6-adenylyltransferase